MQQILISLIIGLIAAVIDTVPMILMKLDKMFIFSAFSFWIVMGLAIPRFAMIQPGWLNGILVTLLILSPMLFLIYKLDGNAIIQVAITSVILGAGVGYISSVFIK
jgi:hypothetical protein